MSRNAPPTPRRRAFRPRPLGRPAAALAALVTTLSAATGQSLRIEKMIEDAPIGEARVAMHAVELSSGRSVVDLDAGEPMIPASNMKLLTTGAALSVLGPDFTYRTELIHADGTLIWRGSGDPALADHRMLARSDPHRGVDDLLDALAASVRDAGVERIDEIVVDDRVLDREWVHDGWPQDQLDRHYCAPVAGLNISGNVLAFFPAPARTGTGDPARFDIEPRAPWIERSTEVIARTVPRGGNRVWIRRDPEKNRFTLGGKVQRPSRTRLRVAVHDPPKFAGRLLADRLEAAGVRLGSGEERTDRDVPGSVRLAGENEQLPEGRTLAVVTTPLLDAIGLCNTDSINLYAEAMFKRLGREVTGDPGSWRHGASVVRMILSQRLGHEAASTTSISDGSGLSRDNEVAPETFTAWLRDLYRDESLRAPFLDSLATPGSGTLRRRFRGVRLEHSVHAKSGSINGVRTLSGYLIDPRSEDGLAFSILVNDLPLSGSASTSARELHERIVGALDEWLTEHLDAARRAEADHPENLGG